MVEHVQVVLQCFLSFEAFSFLLKHTYLYTPAPGHHPTATYMPLGLLLFRASGQCGINSLTTVS